MVARRPVDIPIDELIVPDAIRVGAVPDATAVAIELRLADGSSVTYALTATAGMHLASDIMAAIVDMPYLPTAERKGALS